MVEFRRLPILGAVTLAAVGATLAAMGIIGQVAANATFGRILVVATQMATPATQGLMRAVECKCGLAVIKACSSPVIEVMAVIAGRRQLPTMKVVLLVALDTRAGGLGVLIPRLVATRACKRGMGAS